MFRFYIVIGIFVAIIASILISAIPNLYKIWFSLIAVFGLVFILAIGSFLMNAQLYVQAACKGNSKSNTIAITFDDGPDAIKTPEILEILQKYNFKASFFVIGKKAESNKDIVEKIFKAGHSIGNHSYSHANMFPIYSTKKISAEIVKTNTIIERITDKKTIYFRPPFGVTNPLIYKGLQGLNLKIVGWSVRSFDTNNEKVSTVIKRITRKLKGGDILLLHDTSDNILEILEKLLHFIRMKKIKCVSLEELLHD